MRILVELADSLGCVYVNIITVIKAQSLFRPPTIFFNLRHETDIATTACTCTLCVEEELCDGSTLPFGEQLKYYVHSSSNTLIIV